MVIKTVMFLIIVVVVAAGVALFYLQVRFSESQLPHPFTSADQTWGMDPTICLYDVGGLSEVTSGILHIYDNQLRIGMNIAGTLYAAELDVIIGRDSQYRWANPHLEAMWPSGVNPRQTVDNFLFSGRWRCSPWWFPSETMFNIENNK